MEELNGKFCPRCGAVLQGEEAFCPRCGQGIIETAAVDKVSAEEFNKKVREKKNKATLIAGISVVGVFVIAMVIVAALFLAPKIFKSPEDYIAVGNYEQAYNVAKGDAREAIVKENLIAFISKDIPDSLKDPSSFSLREAWYDEVDQAIVLYVSGANSYGAKISNYWYYTCDSDDGVYELYVTLSSLEKEETKSWDDESDVLMKILENAARDRVKRMIADSSLKLDKTSIQNINKLFEEGLLEEVELLEQKSGTPKA